MAEALAIVGLASNVVQFIDAANGFVSFTHELYKSGSLAENSEIEKKTIALEESLKKLQHGRNMDLDDKLKAMVEACFVLSADLTMLLEGLKPNKQKNHLLQASSKSLKMMRKRGKIKDIERRLEKMRDAICSHLTIIIRFCSDQFHLLLVR